MAEHVVDNIKADDAAVTIADDLEVKSHRASIEDALRANMDAAEEAAKEPSPAKQAAAQARQRAEDGKFVEEPKDKKTKPAVEPAPVKAAPADTTISPAKTDQPPAVSTPAVEPPSSWSKEAKAEWQNLPPHVQQAAAKREKEMADGFAKKDQELGVYRELGQVLAPRMPLLQQVGKSPAQAMDQMWRWHDQLSQPQLQDRYNALAQLGRDYGIDITNQQAQQFGQPGQPQYVQPDINQQIAPMLAPVYQQVQSLDQILRGMQDEKLQNEIASFANAKDQSGNLLRPHYEKAKPLMAKLLQGGVVDDLSSAYQMAVKSDPDITADIEAQQKAVQASEQAATKEAADKAEAERKRKIADQVSSAKRASPSIRTSAPVTATSTGKKSKMTVEQSIREAMADAETRV